MILQYVLGTLLLTSIVYYLFLRRKVKVLLNSIEEVQNTLSTKNIEVYSSSNHSESVRKLRDIPFEFEWQHFLLFWGISAGLAPSLFVILGFIEVVLDELGTNTSSFLAEININIKYIKIWLFQLDMSVVVLFFSLLGLWLFSSFLQRTKNLVERTSDVLSTYKDM